MRCVGIGELYVFTELFDAYPPRAAIAIRGQDLLACRLGEYSTLAAEELQPVVFFGVVAGRDLDSSHGGLLADLNADRWRGGYTQIDRLQAAGRQGGGHGVNQHLAAAAAIATDDHFAGLCGWLRSLGAQRAGQGGNIADRYQRSQLFTDSAAQATDANDRFTHGSTFVWLL